MYFDFIRNELDRISREQEEKFESKCETRRSKTQIGGPIMAKLKPCPFCGGNAIIESFSVRKGFEANVSCTECLANMPTITFDFEETAYLEAIKDWNRRADNGN